MATFRSRATCMPFSASCFLMTLILSMLVPVTASGTIKIGIIGDQTGTTDLDQSYEVLQEGVSLLASQSPAVVLHVGDLVESTQSEEQIRARFAQATGILDQLGVSWYLTAGDHDVNPPVWVPNSPDRSREELYQSLYADLNPRVRSNLYYSIDVTGDLGETYHLISLYSLEHLDTDPRWGDVFFAQLTQAQQQWLEVDLDAHRDAAAVIVWLHQPLWYNWSSWEPVHQLLTRYRVAAVIAGHFHYNQTEGVIDGIDYRVVGATGGTIKNATPYAGGAQHVTMLKANGRDLSYQLLPLNSAEPTAFTPRYDMDRVQAIDNALDNLFGFWSANPVYLLNGQPVTSCQGGQPATLNLNDTGNPIDMPVILQLGLSSDALAISSQRFDPAVCEASSPPGECSLLANANIALSNTSLVQVTTYNPATIWSATLTGKGAGGTSHYASLTVEMSYVSPFSNLPLGISHVATTEVQDCPHQNVHRQVTRESVARMMSRLETERQWVPGGREVDRRDGQVVFRGGAGEGSFSVPEEDVRSRGEQTWIRVGAKAKILEEPAAGIKRTREDQESGACSRTACLGSGISGVPGTLICCDDGQILGRCMGAWPCS